MPTISSIKLALFAIILAALVAFYFRYEYLTKKVAAQEIEIAQAKVNADAMQKQLADAENTRKDYLATIEAAKNENDSLRSHVDDGTTILRVKADCPMPKTSANTTGIATAAPELTADARQNYFALRQGITEINARLDMCIQTLQDERK